MELSQLGHGGRAPAQWDWDWKRGQVREEKWCDPLRPQDRGWLDLTVNISLQAIERSNLNFLKQCLPQIPTHSPLHEDVGWDPVYENRRHPCWELANHNQQLKTQLSFDF